MSSTLAALASLACSSTPTANEPDGGLPAPDDAGPTSDAPVIDGTERGFTAQYFAAYRVLKHVTVEPAIDHAWGDGAPAAGVGRDHFSARYLGTLEVPEAGTYTFATRADDGVRLWIGGERVIGDWRPHLPERKTATVTLPAGPVAIRLEYFEADLGAELALFWTPPGGTESLLDGTHVTAVEPGAPHAEAPKPPYANPVVDTNCPDPGVIAVGDPAVYYAICTGGKFRIRRSHDLVMWSDTGSVVFPDGKPAWAANGGRNWAPEMHEVNGKFLVYYTSVNANDVLSIGVAHSDSPTGPFVDRGSPLVQHPQGVIDASYVRVGNKHYLSYKIDGNSVGQPTPIYLRELATNGLAFAQGSTQVELIRNNPASWEGGVVEGQWIVERNGTFYLFYSGNVYDERYRTGVARASSVTGPYTKLADPILRNDATWVGPGHGSVVSVGGRMYFVYHAWHNDGAGGNDTSRGRKILVDEITFENGWPRIHDGTPSEGLRPWPGQAN